MHVLSSDSIVLVSENISDWYIARPVPAACDRFEGGPPGMAADTLAYTVTLLSAGACSLEAVAGSLAGIPGAGTFYIQALPAGTPCPESLFSTEPPHLVEPATVQIAVRPGDGYADILMETLGTPFVMMPGRTPRGAHQADDLMGFDCAGLAVYGARRLGLDVEYLGPHGILRYLEPVASGQYSPEPEGGLSVYRDSAGRAVAVGGDGLGRGDVLHQRTQVSVFLEDRGIPGLLDSEDLVIQSWFDGPMICALGENGFAGLPLRVMRWRGMPGTE